MAASLPLPHYSAHSLKTDEGMAALNKTAPAGKNGKDYNIWIMGDSYVRRGAQRAAETMGSNLGIQGTRICWFGWGGLRWRGLLPFFAHSLRGRTAPDVLLVHCGGNDVGEVSGVKLLNVMKEDLQHLRVQHPHMKIILSGITQRCRWKAVSIPAKIEKSRKFINSVMATFLRTLDGALVEHPHIKHDSPGLFLRDGVHFTPRGNDIFLTDIAKSLKDHFQTQ
ncbi:uncharacterized protein LOC117813099 [Notolabrus celidotus]|uniref:uncharacterized protein LOC117813099 n=1 Tax=Notolabrus celidotus TaxID=1203425 RepID=UPI00148FB037|nr:uncharacterized protein LOC117813099 [Notolabrus celidotus]